MVEAEINAGQAAAASPNAATENPEIEEEKTVAKVKQLDQNDLITMLAQQIRQIAG